MTPERLALQFVLQLIVILAACQLLGVLMRRLSQPHVIAEIAAGVLLGPSFLGLFWPDLAHAIFPPASMGLLQPVAQLGLTLYMFVIGLEFRTDVLGEHRRAALAVSTAGVAVPFALGAGLGWVLYAHTQLFPPRTPLPDAMLFLGASMCITAFPVLARIIRHKNLGGTEMGTISLAAGALGDAVAWGLLAVVLASLDGNISHAAVNIGAGLAYVLVVLGVVRPLLARRAVVITARGHLSETEMALALLLMLMGAWCTDHIGLHAVLGAFVMGAAMPRGLVTDTLIARIEPLDAALLLPLFFTSSGLNTQLTLLDSGRLWLIAALILVVAILGKVVACGLAARATGIGARPALGIGILMNARGLMELIILNIGLQRGIITPPLFAALVVMAVLTTVMTSPVFDWLVAREHIWPRPIADDDTR